MHAPNPRHDNRTPQLRHPFLTRRDAISRVCAVSAAGAITIVLPGQLAASFKKPSFWNWLKGEHFQVLGETFSDRQIAGRLKICKVSERDDTTDRHRPKSLGAKTISVLFQPIDDCKLLNASYRLINRRIGRIDLLLSETRSGSLDRRLYEAVIN